MSHLCLYVGLKHAGAVPDFGATNLWIDSGADHDASVGRFAADPAQPFPALFISFPSTKDPSFQNRFPGRSTIDVVAPVPYGWFAQWADTRWKKRAGYDQFKQYFNQRLRDELERHVPAVRGYFPRRSRHAISPIMHKGRFTD